MAINNFIPQVWGARLLENLSKSLVYGEVANRDYEGEIKQQGDRVKINSIGAITIGDYAKNTDISATQTLDGSQQELVIDQAKYFNFQVDDVDRVQQRPKVMDGAMAEAGRALADISDKYIAGLYVGADKKNLMGVKGSSNGTAKTEDFKAVKIDAAGLAYEKLVDLSVVLDEANVPKATRWVIIPAWYHGILLRDNRFVKAGTEVQNSILLNGIVGRAAGFDIRVSNNVPSDSADKGFKIQAGYRGTISYASQITEITSYRPEKRFADAVKGLHVFGAKLVRPSAMAVLVVDRG
jgi:hypothetical protein